MQHELEAVPPRHPAVVSTSDLPALPTDKPIIHGANYGRPTRASKPTILTPVEAGELLCCDDKTITRWARQGYIPAHPVGQGKKKYWRFFEDELIDWLMDQKNGAFAA